MNDKKRILLVDDDEQMLALLKIWLERSGYDVVQARNGKEALAAFHQQRVDLILTDLVMPEKEGLETIAEIRKQGSEVKIVAMSGAGHLRNFDYLVPAKFMGANSVIAKPFTRKDIVSVIESALA